MKRLLNWLCRWLNAHTQQQVHVVGLNTQDGIVLSDGKTLDHITSFQLSYEPCNIGRIHIETVVQNEFWIK